MRQHGFNEREAISDNGVRVGLEGTKGTIRSGLWAGDDTIVSLGLPRYNEDISLSLSKHATYFVCLVRNIWRALRGMEVSRWRLRGPVNQSRDKPPVIVTDNGR